jgi:transcriptional regulator with XRE-family HTH domain
MTAVVHYTHIERKPFCASSALAMLPGARNTLCMARHRTFLRQWREFLGKKLVPVAEHLHMSHSQLSRIERGQQPYNQELLEALAELYMCDVVDLLIRDPSEPESMWTLWERAKPGERRQIRTVAEALIARTGTDG